MNTPVAETGHVPNEAYLDRQGNVQLNGATLSANTGPSPGFVLESAVDGLTAHAGGGQAAATPLTAQSNGVSTVATIADSVLLPPSVPGLSIAVTNESANSLDVYPAAGEAINALGANGAYALAAATTVVFRCYTAGAWRS